MRQMLTGFLFFVCSFAAVTVPVRPAMALARLQRFATGFKKIAGGGPNGMADFRDF